MAKLCSICGKQLSFRNSFVWEKKTVCRSCLKQLEQEQTGIEELMSTSNKQKKSEIKKPEVNLGGWGALANFFNPFMVILLIFLGPPGWILILLHATACNKMRSKALELANKAAALRAEGREDDALLYLQAIEENFRPEWRPNQVTQIKGKTLSQKLKVSGFKQLTEWQQPAENDIISAILIRTQKASILIYSEIEDKGQAFYNGEILEYTLPNTKSLPSELVGLVKHRGFQEYSDQTEQELMSKVQQPYEEVTAIGIVEDKPELVVLKTENNNMVTVERTSFEYLFQRYKKIRAFDDSKPVLFYDTSFIHGYLWPSNA